LFRMSQLILGILLSVNKMGMNIMYSSHYSRHFAQRKGWGYLQKLRLNKYNKNLLLLILKSKRDQMLLNNSKVREKILKTNRRKHHNGAMDFGLDLDMQDIIFIDGDVVYLLKILPKIEIFIFGEFELILIKFEISFSKIMGIWIFGDFEVMFFKFKIEIPEGFFISEQKCLIDFFLGQIGICSCLLHVYEYVDQRFAILENQVVIYWL
ncbi:hypothetical protein ACJX0J_027105, partial [Zea mays]